MSYLDRPPLHQSHIFLPKNSGFLGIYNHMIGRDKSISLWVFKMWTYVVTLKYGQTATAFGKIWDKQNTKWNVCFLYLKWSTHLQEKMHYACFPKVFVLSSTHCRNSMKLQWLRDTSLFSSEHWVPLHSITSGLINLLRFLVSIVRNSLYVPFSCHNNHLFFFLSSFFPTKLRRDFVPCSLGSQRKNNNQSSESQRKQLSFF